MPKTFLIRRRIPKRPDNLQWIRRSDDLIETEETERKDGEFQSRKTSDYINDIKPDNGLFYVNRTSSCPVQNSQETFGDEQVFKVVSSNNLVNLTTSVSEDDSSADVPLLAPSSFGRRFFPLERYVESSGDSGVTVIEGDPGVAVIEAGEISTTQCVDFMRQSESSSSLPPRWNGFEETAKYAEPIKSHGITPYASQGHYRMFARIKSCLDLTEGRGCVTAIKDLFSYPGTTTWKSSFDRFRKRKSISTRWKATAGTVVGSWAKADSKARRPGSRKSSDSRGTLETIENRIGEYICQLCKNHFPDAFRLADHNCSCIHHVEYRCSECNKVFNCPANLASHRRWHKPESKHHSTATGKDQASLRRRPTAGPSSGDPGVLTRPLDNEAPFCAHVRSADW